MKNPCGGRVEGLHLALRVVGDDRKGTQCLGAKLGYPVPGRYKYRDLALQVGRVSNLRKYGHESRGTRT
jgi:hypothetical protein